MSTIKHRFLEHKINPETEILILGTFNPDTEKNEADFFYGRSRNYLWKLLPTAFQKTDLKKASKQEKLSFIKQERIDFIDLIAEIEVEKGQETNYNDDFIDSRVIKWQDIISETRKLNKLKKILLTRKTFTGIPNMKNQIEIIQDYCFKNGIYFKALLTPARFYNESKQTEWTNFLTNV
jgi:G:T/U-mismatch repair DNA glycosylase